jgi:hypothetical protein
MGTQSDAPSGLAFGAWLRQHKKSCAILGSLIVLTTYVCKDILQTGLQDKMQNVERWRMEARIDERLDQLAPSLREELSNGSDPQKRFAGQAATLFLQSGEYPPGVGKPSVPFATVVDMECAQDDLCRVGEWYRYRGALERVLVENSRLMEVAGKPGFFDLERIELARIGERLSKAKKREEDAFANLTRKAADGNLITPTQSAVAEFASAVNAVEGVTNEQSLELMRYVPDVIERIRRNLRIITVLSGFLFLTGWIVSLLALMYDFGPADTSGEFSKS